MAREFARGVTMKKSHLLGAVCTLGLLLTTPAHATVANVNPADDRTISDLNEDQVGDSLFSQTDDYLRTGFHARFWRSAIEFDLSGIDSGATINSANLFLRDYGSSRDGVLNIWAYSGDGVIAVEDASMTGNLVGTVTIVDAEGTQDFNTDVTAFIQSLVDSGASHAGFLIGADTPTGLGGGASDLCSKENIHCGSAVENYNRPALTVDFTADVPIPGIASGDINGDGVVNTADFLLATQIVMGILIPDSNQMLRGDVAPLVNGVPVPDGNIDTGDLVIIQRKAMSLL